HAEQPGPHAGERGDQAVSYTTPWDTILGNFETMTTDRAVGADSHCGRTLDRLEDSLPLLLKVLSGLVRPEAEELARR
ncbi:hypothetical protein NKH10_31070, partial [Mesorhizobium sp. M1340]|uniref:hypothetical protein n=1 Tax=Mesorhizobium sp. M1340 TaxID=2957087 RepID=UPI00333634B8